MHFFFKNNDTLQRPCGWNFLFLSRSFFIFAIVTRKCVSRQLRKTIFSSVLNEHWPCLELLINCINILLTMCEYRSWIFFYLRINPEFAPFLVGFNVFLIFSPLSFFFFDFTRRNIYKQALLTSLLSQRIVYSCFRLKKSLAIVDSFSELLTHFLVPRKFCIIHSN